MQKYFHGDLAELLIFNKALSAEELAQTTVAMPPESRYASFLAAHTNFIV